MTAEYNAFIRAEAPKVRDAMRAGADRGAPVDVFVWAVFTTAERDGYLHAGADYPAEPIGSFELVRPGPGYRSWGAVPYSAVESALWHALRSVPILPIPRDAFSAADAANADGAKVAALDSLERQRRARRAAEPMPAGGLFDITTRDQKELF